MYANGSICAQKPPRVFHMYRREHPDQLSFKDFFLPFGGQLSGDNRWIKLAELIPWDELEDDYASQFCKGFGAPAKPFRMALGALIIKARLGLTDEELVEQIKENPYLQFFIGLEACQCSAPFDPSMMVHFRKRLQKWVVNDCNKRIVPHGLNVIHSFAVDENDDHDSTNGGGAGSAADQKIDSKTPRPNQGSLLIDATCVPADIRHPTDLSLLNVGRELTETLIDAMHSQVRGQGVLWPYATHASKESKTAVPCRGRSRRLLRSSRKNALGFSRSEKRSNSSWAISSAILPASMP